ncbi:Hydroxycinnamoyltransferase 1 [Bienertia sinuspersici]
MVLSAFIWSRFKVACHNGVNKIPFELFHAANIRGRVGAPDEQSYYFGNMVVNAIVKPSLPFKEDEKADQESSLWWSGIVRQMEESIGNIMSNDGHFIRDIQKGKEDLKFTREQFEKESKGEIILLGFSNGQNLPVYEADFGWGKPVWVTSATLIFNNLVILIPAGPSNRDIVAYINLSDHHMAKLETDAEFNALVSKVPHVTSKL